MTTMHTQAQTKLSPREEQERMCRLDAAVSLVERGDTRGCKVSVRRAAALYGIPKSTVHSKIQANRGIKQRRRRRTRRVTSSRTQEAVSHKLRIGFLVNQDSEVSGSSAAPSQSGSLDYSLQLPPLRPVDSFVDRRCSRFQDPSQLNLLLPVLQ